PEFVSDHEATWRITLSERAAIVKTPGFRLQALDEAWSPEPEAWSHRSPPMSRVLYFDCFSGISGDMALGAMLDAGLPLDDLKGALGSLAVSGFDVSAVRVLRAGVSATRFTVHEHGGAQHDHGH